MAALNTEDLKKTLRDVKPHRQGYSIIKEALIWLLIINGFLYFLQINNVVFQIFATISIFVFLFILYAFRNPERSIVPDDEAVFAPVDGKVKAIESYEETDYFNDRRVRISFHTSPWDVHVKRAPVRGEVVYCKFEHENMAETIIEHSSGRKFMIAHRVGYFRKFIFSFSEKGKYFDQGDELGILGSQLDIILPPQFEIKIKVGDKVRANDTIIARFR